MKKLSTFSTIAILTLLIPQIRTSYPQNGAKKTEYIPGCSIYYDKISPLLEQGVALENWENSGDFGLDMQEKTKQLLREAKMGKNDLKNCVECYQGYYLEKENYLCKPCIRFCYACNNETECT